MFGPPFITLYFSIFRRDLSVGEKYSVLRDPEMMEIKCTEAAVYHSIQ